VLRRKWQTEYRTQQNATIQDGVSSAEILPEAPCRCNTILNANDKAQAKEAWARMHRTCG